MCYHLHVFCGCLVANSMRIAGLLGLLLLPLLLVCSRSVASVRSLVIVFVALEPAAVSPVVGLVFTFVRCRPRPCSCSFSWSCFCCWPLSLLPSLVLSLYHNNRAPTRNAERGQQIATALSTYIAVREVDTQTCQTTSHPTPFCHNPSHPSPSQSIPAHPTPSRPLPAISTRYHWRDLACLFVCGMMIKEIWQRE